MTKHQITTNTRKHHISTVWVEALGCYETMVFKYKGKAKIDWSGESTERTEDREQAINHHISAIIMVMEWESHAKNA
jgi:hypothetical protein